MYSSWFVWWWFCTAGFDNHCVGFPHVLWWSIVRTVRSIVRTLMVYRAYSDGLSCVLRWSIVRTVMVYHAYFGCLSCLCGGDIAASYWIIITVVKFIGTLVDYPAYCSCLSWFSFLSVIFFIESYLLFSSHCSISSSQKD